MLLLAAVLVCVGTHPPPPPAFALNGECAGVKQRETWKASNGQPHWSYRIKVSPWVLFGRVRVALHGWDMVVEKNYSCAVEKPGKTFTAILHPKPGLDDTFQIMGTGEPYADPDLECEGLQERNATADCPLGPRFVVESDWDSLQTGRFQASVQLNMWVLQSIITLDFGGPMHKVTIGHDLYGARLTEGGDGTSSRAEVTLLPLKHCLGMYKDTSCNNAFGFSAVLSPSLRALPKISCLLTRSMPTPPPPSPPFPPPSPPPGFIIDRNLCYLGGRAHFVVAPHKVASKAALQTWVVAVHLDDWLGGLRVVLDFPGVVHAEHGLHVAAVSPGEVVRLVSVTRHSAIVELLPTAARDFRFEALGDVDEVRVVCDIGDARPPPPPPPLPPAVPVELSAPDGASGTGTMRMDASRSAQNTQQQQQQPLPLSGVIQGQHDPPPPPPPPPVPAPVAPRESGPWGFVISVALLLYLGYHAKEAHSNPGPYMVLAAEKVRWVRQKLASTPRGRRILMKITGSAVGAMLMRLEARHLGLPGSADHSMPVSGQGVSPTKSCQEEAPRRAAPPKPKPKALRQGAALEKESLEQEEPLVGHIEGFDDTDEEEVQDRIPPSQSVAASHEIEPEGLSAAKIAAADFVVGDKKDTTRRGKSKATTTLLVRVGSVDRKTEIDLKSVRDMAGLQLVVANVCKSFGTDLSQGGLRMQYVDDKGEVCTVTRSTEIRSLRGARKLTMLPKTESATAPTRGSRGAGSSGGGAHTTGRARDNVPSRSCRVPLPSVADME